MNELKFYPDADAALLFVSGQSNATGHQQFLPEDERIVRPLKNVWALDRRDAQSYTTTSVTWHGYTDEGKNLGEIQDFTGSIDHYIAAAWQAAIDAGASLPDLYIVHISVGGQGLVRGMWREDKPEVLVPGPFYACDIGLYRLAMHTLSLVSADLKRRFARPAAIGWHWIGSEGDSDPGVWDAPDRHERFDRFFDTQLAAIGLPCRVYFYKLVFTQCAVPGENWPQPFQTDAVNDEFARQVGRLPDAELVTAEDCPLWDAADPLCGIFADDGIHYLRQTQEWFARHFLDEIAR